MQLYGTGGIRKLDESSNDKRLQQPAWRKRTTSTLWLPHQLLSSLNPGMSRAYQLSMAKKESRAYQTDEVRGVKKGFQAGSPLEGKFQKSEFRNDREI